MGVVREDEARGATISILLISVGMFDESHFLSHPDWALGRWK
jgi:hypothetical protein